MRKYILILLLIQQSFLVAQNCNSIDINQNLSFTTNNFNQLTFGIKVNITQAASVLSLDALLNSSVQTAQMAIYTNLDNRPYELVTTSQIVTNNLQNTQIVNFPPTENIIIQPGDYWILLEFRNNYRMNFYSFSNNINYIEFQNYGNSIFLQNISPSINANYQSNQTYAPLGITLDCTASVNDFNYNTLMVYPNPARDNLYINGLNKSTTYNIFNIQGCLIQNGNVDSYNPVTLNNLCSGIYFIKLNEKVIKFIKQ